MMDHLTGHDGQATQGDFLQRCRYYQALREDQEKLRSGEGREQAYAIVIKAFQQMPNLKAATLNPKPCCGPKRLDTPPKNEVRWYDPSDEYGVGYEREMLWLFADLLKPTQRHPASPSYSEL
ncbi:MAG: hypothetical protein L6R39_003428 [Caloplaca ligustica]|nr:MAG: hypothetical protein L6R39_003428 [Caloplaca ligustica]